MVLMNYCWGHKLGFERTLLNSTRDIVRWAGESESRRVSHRRETPAWSHISTWRIRRLAFFYHPIIRDLFLIISKFFFNEVLCILMTIKWLFIQSWEYWLIVRLLVYDWLWLIDRWMSFFLLCSYCFLLLFFPLE